MKTIYVNASPDLNKPANFFKYKYLAFRHPCAEWGNIFEADYLGMGFKSDSINWKEYDLAIVFAHGAGIGAAALVRKLVPKIKIFTIPEPPPTWMLRRIPFGLFKKFKEDCEQSDIVGVAQECFVEDWKKYFGKNLHYVPLPLNIPEYIKRTDLSKRENIIATSGHCNFAESGTRSYRVIQEAKHRCKGYRTRCFYAITTKYLKDMGLDFDEACHFDWDIEMHIKRLNECRIMVDDNISPASGHMCVEMAAMGIPSVGSNTYIYHLFPEMSMKVPINKPKQFRKHIEVQRLAEHVVNLANDKTFYDKMVKLGTKRLYETYSYESCKKRLLELLE